MINDRVEVLILKNYLYNEFYMKRVLPFIKAEYFHDPIEKIVFKKIQEFISKYKNAPSKEALYIDLSNDTNITQNNISECNDLIKSLALDETVDQNWLIQTTEKFCQDKAIYNAIQKSIKIISDDSGKGKDGIPSILSDALSVSFNNDIGHDYIENSSDRYGFYHRVESKIKSDIELLNKITYGGVTKKTLNIILAATGIGKSFLMCHLAARYFYSGLNVVYITLEMSEENIAQRIELNLFDMNNSELKALSKEQYDNKINNVKVNTLGKLIIKEYPPGSYNSNHFKAFLNELKLKKGFVPDVVFVDYLNLATSSRYSSQTAKEYTYIKGVSEELRGLAVEFNVPIWTATQGNRSSYNSTDLSLENTSESYGINSTGDLIIALISTEELEQMNRIIIKQLKNRYNDLNYYKKFLVGIDRSKMKFFDVDPGEETQLADSGKKDEDKPVFDSTDFGKSKFNDMPNFSGINYEE